MLEAKLASQASARHTQRELAGFSVNAKYLIHGALERRTNDGSKRRANWCSPARGQLLWLLWHAAVA